MNCQISGANAMILVNNSTVAVRTIANSSITIPFYLMSPNDGMTITSSLVNRKGTIKSQNEYQLATDSVLSSAHVVGAIARIWRARRNCNNTEVIQCITETAVDLGTVGKDDYYGHGLVQTRAAYRCLKRQC